MARSVTQPRGLEQEPVTEALAVADLEPLATASVVDSVYESLRRLIASGAMPPGQRLHQAEIAQRLGTSRTPVREALGRLTADRLVDFQPNRGFFVATMSEARTRAAVEARQLLEPLMARLAAGRRPAAALARMRLAVAAERAATDPWDAYAASRDFHLALAESAGNEFLERVAEQLWAADLGRPLYQAYVNLSGSAWISADARQHDRIRRAIESGDAEAAQAAVGHHLETARTYMQSVLHEGADQRPAG